MRKASINDHHIVRVCTSVVVLYSRVGFNGASTADCLIMPKILTIFLLSILRWKLVNLTISIAGLNKKGVHQRPSHNSCLYFCQRFVHLCVCPRKNAISFFLFFSLSYRIDPLVETWLACHIHRSVKT